MGIELGFWVVLTAVLTVVFIVLYYANRIGANRIRVRRIDVELEKVKGEFRILHLSDLHFYSGMPERRLDNVHRAVDKLYAETAPDLVCVTGDFIDNDGGKEFLPALIAKLSSQSGVYAVLGNHDYFEYGFAHVFQTLFEEAGKRPADTHGLLKLLRECGVRVLVDKNVRIAPGIVLHGVDAHTGRDLIAEKLPEAGTDAALKIALSHYPDVSLVMGGRYDLLLAGHTHGGQIAFFGLPILTRSRIKGKMIRGLTYKDGAAMYVSHGAGVSRYFPFRLFAPAEVALITLRGKK